MTHAEPRYAVDTITRRGWRVEEPDLTHAEALDAAEGLHFVGFEPQGVRLRQLDANGDAPPRGGKRCSCASTTARRRPARGTS